MIDIIIPIYNSLNSLSISLNSIREQTIKNITNIYLIDDCSEEDYSIFLKEYNDLNIIYYKQDINLGAGLARQTGLNISKSEYILFLDSDDSFYSKNSLEILYNEIVNDYDYVWGITLDEKRNALLYNESDLHAKLYKRKFIEKNNIEFNKTRFHEDNYFNNLVLACSPRIKKTEKIIYIYKYNALSLTNKNDCDEFERLEILLSNMNELLKECKKRNSKKETVIYLIFIKIKYFNRIIHKFNFKEKEIFYNWIKKYNLKLEKYLGNENYDEIYNDMLENYEY